jgi:uncharacterized protein (TIGR02246 family)
MKRILLITVIAAAYSVGRADVKGDPQDERAIRKVVQDATDCINRHDFRGQAMFFTEDADSRSPGGNWRKGKAQLEEAFERVGKNVPKNFHYTRRIEQIRFLRTDVALVEGIVEMTGGTNSDGTHREPFAGLFQFVMTKDNGRWLIAAVRAIVSPPAPSPPAQK